MNEIKPTEESIAKLHNSDTWIFDLDNTLYPERCNLFAQIDEKMGHFISERFDLEHKDAKAMQKKYFMEHGTTLNGLMSNHNVAPKDFLDFVHDIDYTHVPRDEQLNQALHQIQGRKIIFTNGTVKHAENTLDQLGISHHFDYIFDIVESEYIPKPAAAPYDKLIALKDIDPTKAVMVEDMAKNLKYPAEVGMSTVWVKTSADWSSMGSEGGHINHMTDDLSDWLHNLVNAVA